MDFIDFLGIVVGDRCNGLAWRNLWGGKEYLIPGIIRTTLLCWPKWEIRNYKTSFVSRYIEYTDFHRVYLIESTFIKI